MMSIMAAGLVVKKEKVDIRKIGLVTPKESESKIDTVVAQKEGERKTGRAIVAVAIPP